MLYAYVGGSGKKLNQEVIGTNVIRTIVDRGYRIALERYLHEMSSEMGSKEALQTFVDGIADWEANEPGVKKRTKASVELPADLGATTRLDNARPMPDTPQVLKRSP